MGQDALKNASCKLEKHKKTFMENQHIFIFFSCDTFSFLAVGVIELLNWVQRLTHSNIMIPISMNFIFKRIIFFAI